MRTARTALIVALIAGLGRLAWSYPALPDTVPSHFNAAGQADGWSSKLEFTVLFACLILLMGGTFLGISWLIRKLPIHMINLPNREVWLSDERIESTLDDLDARMAWMGVVLVLFMVAILEMSIRLAMAGGDAFPPSALPILTGVFLVVITAQTIGLLVRYSRKPRDGSS